MPFPQVVFGVPTDFRSRSQRRGGRKFAEGWPIYVRWITWVWQGQVERVIAELAQRQAELGMPEKDEAETSPRQLVAGTLTYLQNH